MATTDGIQLLTPRQTAEALGVEISTLAAWRYRGTGPPFIKLSATAVRYALADVEEFVAAQRRASTADAGGWPTGDRCE